MTRAPILARANLPQGKVGPGPGGGANQSNRLCLLALERQPSHEVYPWVQFCDKIMSSLFPSERHGKGRKKYLSSDNKSTSFSFFSCNEFSFPTTTLPTAANGSRWMFRMLRLGGPLLTTAHSLSLAHGVFPSISVFFVCLWSQVLTPYVFFWMRVDSHTQAMALFAQFYHTGEGLHPLYFSWCSWFQRQLKVLRKIKLAGNLLSTLSSGTHEQTHFLHWDQGLSKADPIPPPGVQLAESQPKAFFPSPRTPFKRLFFSSL